MTYSKIKHHTVFIKVLFIFASIFVTPGLMANYLLADEEGQDQKPLAVQLFQAKGHTNNDYVKELLRLALDKSGKEYFLNTMLVDAEQGREINIVKRYTGAVITCGTSKEFEEEMLPVRIPIYRGMLGYRIGIINKSRQPEFSAVQSIDDFRKMSIGQGIGWADTEILKAGGFKVITADYQMLFKMVSRNRYDCFLRGINEAFDEVKVYGRENPEIAVETDLVLYYPFAMFFFVNRDDKELAHTIETGLKRAYEDGSFLDFFKTHPQTKSVLEDARLEDRRLFKIDNPTMTDQTKSIPSRYWLFVQKKP